MSMIAMIAIGRERTKHEIQAEMERSMDGLYKNSERIWIPDDASKLKLRVAVKAHCVERRQRA